MRTALVLLAAVLAAVGGSLGPAPARADALAGTYPLHLKFNLVYEVDWSEAAGLEGLAQDSCASWSKDRGSVTVTAQDAAWKRPGENRARRHGIPGSLSFPGPRSTWAGGSMLGWAKATVNRRWLQSGGPTADDIRTSCPGVSQAWVPTPDDCGARTFTTRTAVFMPQGRRRLVTLDDLMLVAGNPRPSDQAVLAITVVPPRALYQSCKTSARAPEYPANLGVRVEVANEVELARLKPGETLQGDWLKTGACDVDLPKGTTCTFKLDVDWQIRRSGLRERFP